MPLRTDENKHISLSLSEPDRLCPVAKALSSPVRARMLSLLCTRSMNVNELAEALSLPVSTAALNVRQLEEANLIACEIQPGIRGAMKLCSHRIDSIGIRLAADMRENENTLTIHLPIGSYSTAEHITPQCGMVSDHAWIGDSNTRRTFYHPDRLHAQMLWFEIPHFPRRNRPFSGLLHRVFHGAVLKRAAVPRRLQERYRRQRERHAARRLDLPRRFRRQARQAQSFLVERHVLAVRAAQDMARGRYADHA